MARYNKQFNEARDRIVALATNSTNVYKLDVAELWTKYDVRKLRAHMEETMPGIDWEHFFSMQLDQNAARVPSRNLYKFLLESNGQYAVKDPNKVLNVVDIAMQIRDKADNINTVFEKFAALRAEVGATDIASYMNLAHGAMKAMGKQIPRWCDFEQK